MPLSIFSSTGARCVGTSNWRGGLTWVGETGPEIVSLPARSRIYNNAESMALAGGDTINVMAYRVVDIIRAPFLGVNSVTSLSGERVRQVSFTPLFWVSSVSR